MEESGAYNTISISTYWDELNQENDQSIFVSLKMIIIFFTLFLFHMCIFVYFTVDNYDKYHFCIFSLIKFVYDKSRVMKGDFTQYATTFLQSAIYM